MNLLGNQAENAVLMKDEIIAALEEIGLSQEERMTAERFFDFSRELDLSELEKIKGREYPIKDYNKSYNVFDKLQKNKMNDAVNRYILFLDALMGSFAPYALYRYNNFRYYFFERDWEEHNMILHAYRIRYSEEEFQIKMCAIAAQLYMEYFCQSKYLLSIADFDPLLLYKAADKKYSFSSTANPRLRLFSLSLAYNFPHKGKYAPDIIKHKGRNSLSETVCNDMTQYIIKVCCNAVKTMNEDAVFGILVPSLFIALSYQKSREKGFIQRIFENQNKTEIVLFDTISDLIAGKEEKFLVSMFHNMPFYFFDATLDLLFSVGQLGRSQAVISDLIKTAVAGAWHNEFSSGEAKSNAELFLKYCAEHYPEQCMELMYSTEEIKQIYSSGRNSYSRNKYYCCYYDKMYKLIRELSPQTLEQHTVDYKKDVLRVLIETEKLCTDIAKDDLDKYLSGEADLTILEPYFNQLKNHYQGSTFAANELLAAGYKEIYPHLAERYYCLKAIQYPDYVVNAIKHQYYNERNNPLIKEVIEMLNSGGVPMSFRFEVYGRLIDSFYLEELKQAVADVVLEEMLLRKEQYDSEYKSYCPQGGVFARIVYVRYLAESESKQSDVNRNELLAMFLDPSKEVRKALVEVMQSKPDYESDILALLRSKKAAVRETAVDILASWGAEKYREILIETADNEKSAKLADKIRVMLCVANPVDSEKIVSPTALVDNLHKGGKSKKIQWLYTTPNPTVHFKDGNTADDKYLQAIMLCYCGKPEFCVSREANVLAEPLKEEEFHGFVSEIMSKWLADGAEAKKKWVLNFAAVHGGYDMVDIFLHYIKEWSGNMRGAIAAEAVKALAMNGSSLALMTVDNLAHKFKQKQVKKAAVQALESAAEALGLTGDELADRIVPDLGFNEQMEQIFDYGTRKFKVYLTPKLELEVFDENNKKLKNLPTPGKKDDEELAPKANAAFKAIKKQLKSVVSIQKQRLENALSTDRRWEKSAWEALFVKNPVMHSFAIGLIWAAYENGKLTQTFRYMEDGTFNTADEDEYELPLHCEIGLVHPIDIDAAALAAWKEQLEDYEIVQPFGQLDRPVYRINEEETGKRYLERFEGREVNGMSLLGRTSKYGWQKGPVGDAGFFYAFYREDIIRRERQEDGNITSEGTVVELNFEGMYIGGDDSDVKIRTVRFYRPENVRFGSYDYNRVDDEKAIKLDSVKPRYLSEIIYQLEMITKTADKKE